MEPSDTWESPHCTSGSIDYGEIMINKYTHNISFEWWIARQTSPRDLTANVNMIWNESVVYLLSLSFGIMLKSKYLDIYDKGAKLKFVSWFAILTFKLTSKQWMHTLSFMTLNAEIYAEGHEVQLTAIQPSYWPSMRLTMKYDPLL